MIHVSAVPDNGCQHAKYKNYNSLKYYGTKPHLPVFLNGCLLLYYFICITYLKYHQKKVVLLMNNHQLFSGLRGRMWLSASKRLKVDRRV